MDRRAHERNPDIRHLAIAYLASPVVIPFVLIVVFGVGGILHIPPFLFDTWTEHVRRTVSFALSIYVLLFAYAAMLIAIRVLAWMALRNQLTAVGVVGLGAILGGGPFLVFFLYLLLTGDFAGELAGYRTGLIWLAAGTGGGAATAATFWTIAREALVPEKRLSIEANLTDQGAD